jgi:hypothetical protein
VPAEPSSSSSPARIAVSLRRRSTTACVLARAELGSLASIGHSKGWTSSASCNGSISETACPGSSQPTRAASITITSSATTAARSSRSRTRRSRPRSSASPAVAATASEATTCSYAASAASAAPRALTARARRAINNAELSEVASTSAARNSKRAERRPSLAGAPPRGRHGAVPPESPTRPGSPAGRYWTSCRSLNIGRYMAMMITPTIAPTPSIIRGSTIEVSAWIDVSTSSS